ncbi:MAG: DUF5671 domain-containing protein [Bryobacteraceae bacterium]
MEFIAAAKERGASDEFLLHLLRHRGWAEKDIYRAFSLQYERLTGLPLPAARARSGEKARDAFLYILSFSTLAIWATALGSLFFTFIDQAFADPLSTGLQRISYGFSTELASILVALPVYLVAMRFILRDAEESPEKLESGVRKWLTYIALLIAAGISIGDLITFLAYFLRGELTTRFVLKVLTVLAIAGSIFWYYVGSLKRGSDGAAER